MFVHYLEKSSFEDTSVYITSFRLLLEHHQCQSCEPCEATQTDQGVLSIRSRTLPSCWHHANASTETFSICLWCCFLPCSCCGQFALRGSSRGFAIILLAARRASSTTSTTIPFGRIILLLSLLSLLLRRIKLRSVRYCPMLVL
jgi:hypothetical protein